MSNLDEKQKPVTQKASELKSVAETISNQYQGLQTKLSQAAQEAGYGQHQFAKLAKVIEKTPNDSLLEPLGNVLNKHSDYLRLIEGKMYIPTRLGERAFIAVSTAASTSAVVMSLNYKDVKAAMGFTPDPPPFAPQNTDPQRLAKLKRINPELAKIYSSVLEVYYATQNNPERAAM